MVVHRDYEELFALLNSARARYLVVGAHALAFHGKPRFTGDLDIFISADRVNANRVLTSIAKFGFSDVGLSVADFLKANTVVQLGFPPCRIDLMTGISGVRFETAWKTRVRGHYGKEKVWFISKRILIQNKMKTGRERDLIDVRDLKATA